MEHRADLRVAEQWLQHAGRRTVYHTFLIILTPTLIVGLSLQRR